MVCSAHLRINRDLRPNWLSKKMVIGMVIVFGTVTDYGGGFKINHIYLFQKLGALDMCANVPRPVLLFEEVEA